MSIRSSQELCRSGQMVDGLCITPATPILQCPDEHIAVCKKKDRAESPCCARAETAERIARCRDGAESHDGQCTRVLAHAPINECPPGYALSAHETRCIKEEFGVASPLCVYPDVLSPEADSCLTTVQQGFQYVCPDGFECVAYSKKKYKHWSPVCSACEKIEEAIPFCGCGEGQEEIDGFCYEGGLQDVCMTRKGMPRKQAPPKKKHSPPPPPPMKEKDIIEEPEVDCKPLGRVSCICEHPFTLQCEHNSCKCIHRESAPLVPVCRGNTDEDGNCIAQVQKRLLYECAEGFTCDPTDKKGRCRCIRITSAEPTTRCASGKEHEGKCIEVMTEPLIVECPHGFAENCCDDRCTCTRTSLVTREVKCSPGAVSIQGDCAYVSKPSPGCDEVSHRQTYSFASGMT